MNTPEDINNIKFETLTKEQFNDMSAMMEAMQHFLAGQAIGAYRQTGCTEIMMQMSDPYPAFVVFELRKSKTSDEIALFAKVIDKERIGKMN